MVVELQPEEIVNDELRMKNEDLAAQQDEQLLAFNPTLTNNQLSVIHSQILPVLHFQEELERQCCKEADGRQHRHNECWISLVKS